MTYGEIDAVIWAKMRHETRGDALAEMYDDLQTLLESE